MNTDVRKSPALRTIILVCMVIAVLLRLYKLNSPLIEQYSNIQTNVLTYAKEVEHNPMLFVSLQTRTDNEYAGNVVAYGGLIGLVHRALPVLSLEITARLISIVCAIMSLIFSPFIMWHIPVYRYLIARQYRVELLSFENFALLKL